jgi:hypothetical protein
MLKAEGEKQKLRKQKAEMGLQDYGTTDYGRKADTLKY